MAAASARLPFSRCCACQRGWAVSADSLMPVGQPWRTDDASLSGRLWPKGSQPRGPKRLALVVNSAFFRRGAECVADTALLFQGPRGWPGAFRFLLATLSHQLSRLVVVSGCCDGAARQATPNCCVSQKHTHFFSSLSVCVLVMLALFPRVGEPGWALAGCTSALRVPDCRSSGCLAGHAFLVLCHRRSSVQTTSGKHSTVCSPGPLTSRRPEKTVWLTLAWGRETGCASVVGGATETQRKGCGESGANRRPGGASRGTWCVMQPTASVSCVLS